MKSYWIWNYGDYEIFHSNRVNARRQEFGVDYPTFWKYYDVDRNVRFYTEIETETDGNIKLFLNGKGYILVDGQRYATEKVILLQKGKHTLQISVVNLTGLPAAYIESDVCSTNNEWYTLENGAKKQVGFDIHYDCQEKNPESFPFAYEEKYPVSVQKYNEGVLYDFGKELFGFLYVSDVKASESIHVSYGESLEEAVDVENSILFEDVSGENRYKLRQRAFRYIYLTGAENANIHAELEYLPIEYKGSFRCDDEDVNKIWDVCAYTLHLNMREVLTEAIKRDRWLWGGDAYQAFKFNNYLFFDKEIVRRSTIALRGKEPFNEHINTITDYSLYWVIGLHEYYVTYGDIEFIKNIYDKAVSLMEFCEAREDDKGFIVKKNNDWIFVDWSDIDKDGAVCAEQMLYIAANKAMAALTRLVGADPSSYEEKYSRLIETTNKFFWKEEKGAYIDCYESGKNHISRHANVFAILYDVANEEQKAKIIENVLENDKITKITTPYFEGFELDVMGKIGHFDFIENVIKTYWKGMLDLGATTVWEEYNPNLSGAQHYEMYGNKYGKSLCHAWGASPIYLLGKYYLGVTPTSSGYETFEVKPYLGGFKFIDGVVPIKDGSVRVKLSKDKLSVVATKNGGTLIWAGKSYALEANKELNMNI
jgi:alpha-L-rhamnosidase